MISWVTVSLIIIIAILVALVIVIPIIQERKKNKKIDEYKDLAEVSERKMKYMEENLNRSLKRH